MSDTDYDKKSTQKKSKKNARETQSHEAESQPVDESVKASLRDLVESAGAVLSDLDKPIEAVHWEEKTSELDFIEADNANVVSQFEELAKRVADTVAKQSEESIIEESASESSMIDMPGESGGSALTDETPVSEASLDQGLTFEEQSGEAALIDAPVESELSSPTEQVSFADFGGQLEEAEDDALPADEGAFDVGLELVERGGLRWSRAAATRTVQVVAIADAPFDPPDVPWNVVYELDPGSPKLLERLRRLPGMGLPSLPVPSMTLPKMPKASFALPKMSLPTGALPAMPLPLRSTSCGNLAKQLGG
jgi:hypothetical protein